MARNQMLLIRPSWTIALRKRFLFRILHDHQANQSSFGRAIAYLYWLGLAFFFHSIKHLDLPKIDRPRISKLVITTFVGEKRKRLTSGPPVFLPSWGDSLCQVYLVYIYISSIVMHCLNSSLFSIEFFIHS